MPITIIQNARLGGILKIVIEHRDHLFQLANPQLLSIHNAATGRSTKKFATRDKALDQTWRAIRDFVEIDLRILPPVLSRAEGVASPQVAAPSAPSPATPAKGRGRPAATREFNAEKQKDGGYLFRMQPRVQKHKPGGRRPELLRQLSKRPTFRQLLKTFDVPGETDTQRAFNLATSITLLGGMCGHGVVTAADGKLELLEPLS